MRHLFTLALAGGVAAGFSLHVSAQQTIKIGELNSYKAQPAFLDPYKKGWEMAIEEINAKGGVLGKKLEVISRDDGANPGEAVRAAEEGRSLPPLPEEVPMIKDAGDYAGTYTAADGRRFVVSDDGGQLALAYKGQKVVLQPRGTDSFFVNHPDFTLFDLHFGRDKGKVVEAFYGGEWFTNERYVGLRQFPSPPQWAGYAGHYRAAPGNFRIVLRKGKLWLIAPEDDEMTLAPMPGGYFALAFEGRPARERISFDTPVHGKTLRAPLSGVAYYRTFTP